jgi:purine-binding chemotaxis protein CheW
LFFRVHAGLYAMPIEHVEETMRPLPIVPIAGAPPFLSGMARIRGRPVPVVAAGTLLGGSASHPTRFIVVNTEGRRMALAVDAVSGIREIPAQSLGALPSLVRSIAPDVLAAIGELDGELMLLLSASHLIPETVWVDLLGEEAPA